MEKVRETSTDSIKENNLSQITDENIRNHLKARYLNLVSQTSPSSIQYGNEKAMLIAADLALQYLQRHDMSLTLDSATSESHNLLVRQFTDRWLARTLQIRGRQEVLHGLILSKKNNTFDIGFGPNFIKNKREEGEKYKSSTFRSKSLPSEKNNLLKTSMEEEKTNEDTNSNNESANKTKKQTNDSENQIRSRESKSSKSSKNKNSRKSYESQKKTQNLIEEEKEPSNHSAHANISESQHNSSQNSISESQHYSPQNNNLESQQYSSQLNQKDSRQISSNKHSSKHEIEKSDSIDSQIDDSNLYSQLQENSSKSGDKIHDINNDATNSNILPSPLKTTYSGRENEDISENSNEIFGTDDEMKTHTYEYSTIYSCDEPTHVTQYEYSTIYSSDGPTHETQYEYETLTQQSSEINDDNSKAYEYSFVTDISSQRANQIKGQNDTNYSSMKNKNYTESISTSPKINPSTTYEYYPSYTIKEENENSTNNQTKEQKEDLQLQFPFVQSRSINIPLDKEQNPNQPNQPKHADYYAKKHSKGQKDKLIFSNPVEFSNPDNFTGSSIENEGHIAAMKREAEAYQDEPEIILEEEEEDIEPTNNFFIFHAVDIQPDCELQKLFKSQSKHNKEKPNNLIQGRRNISQQYNSFHKESSFNKMPQENPTDIKRSNKKNNNILEVEEREVLLCDESSSNMNHVNENLKNNNIKSINLSEIEKEKPKHDPSIGELFDNINSTSHNKKTEKSSKKNLQNQTENDPNMQDFTSFSSESSCISISSNTINKTKHHRHYHKHLHHGSIKRGSHYIEKINRNLNYQSNNTAYEREIQLNNEYSSPKKVMENDLDDALSSSVSSLIIPPSSSSSPISVFSSGDQIQEQKHNDNSLVTDYNLFAQNKNIEYENQILNEKNRKTKFSNKLESSKIDNKKKLNRQSSLFSLKKSKNATSSMESFHLEDRISESSTITSIAKICESISEDELMEMSDASPVSFD